jgi:hypothetical protein
MAAFVASRLRRARRRAWAGPLFAVAAAVIIAACGNPYVAPSPPPGGGGGGGGPVVVNTPPQVKSVAISDTRVEVGTPITLTATVEDLETPVANLSFAWTIPPGSVTGTENGSAITFTPSADLKTPGDYEITVTVTERYTSAGVQTENKATSSVTLHINNSPKELADLALRFLGDFANSNISPERCVSEFTDSCGGGKKAELQDIIDNRHDFLILSSSLRHTSLQIASSRTSATVITACAFTSRVISQTPQSGGCLANPASCQFGSTGTADGNCKTTHRYEGGRWWLCESTFESKTALTAFERAFFGIRRPEI